MPVGNLRTAANNDQDDDPRALRPIPIATKDTVSFVEKNQPGQNAEVVRFIFLCFSPTSRFDHHRFRMMLMMTRACFFRARDLLFSQNDDEFSFFVFSLSFSLSQRCVFSSRDLNFLIFPAND